MGIEVGFVGCSIVHSGYHVWIANGHQAGGYPHHRTIKLVQLEIEAREMLHHHQVQPIRICESANQRTWYMTQGVERMVVNAV